MHEVVGRIDREGRRHGTANADPLYPDPHGSSLTDRPRGMNAGRGAAPLVGNRCARGRRLGQTVGVIQPAEILAQLDAVHAESGFPDLDNGYYYAIDCRLRAYSDGERWALIVETVGYSPRGSNVDDVLHYFGNCLTSGKPGYENDDFLVRIDNGDELEDEEDNETFSGAYSGAPAIRIRGIDLPVDAAPRADLVDLYRALVPAHRELLLATEPELRRRIPADLPRVLQLEEWHQPDHFDTPPSACEVYTLLAAVLSTADADQYQPTETPNTHWKQLARIWLALNADLIESDVSERQCAVIIGSLSMLLRAVRWSACLSVGRGESTRPRGPRRSGLRPGEASFHQTSDYLGGASSRERAVLLSR
jgi:hypothetical protein